MDNITIDLGPETEVEPGDEAVLIGAQGEDDDPRRGGRRAASTRSTTRSPAGSRPGCRGARHELSAERPRRRSPLVAAAARALAGRGAGLDRRRRGARRGAGPRGRRPRPRRRRRPRPCREGRRRRAGRARLRALGRVRHLARRRPASAAGRSTPTVLRGEGIDADLAARDFTVGAVAVPLAGGEPLDPFGGLADLERGVLRAVGEGSFERGPAAAAAGGAPGRRAGARDRPRHRRPRPRRRRRAPPTPPASAS